MTLPDVSAVQLTLLVQLLSARPLLQAKLELEAQMRESARRRREEPMSALEKAVNKPLLQHVDAFEATAQLPLQPYPAEFLPRDLQAVQAQLTEQHARAALKTARGGQQSRGSNAQASGKA